MLVRRQHGFTLVELLVGLAVAAILLTAAVPNLADLIRANQASASINEFVYALHLARSEAVTESVPVTVCQSAGQGCDKNPEWEKGWVVFLDPDDDGACTDSEPDDVCDEDGGRILHYGKLSGVDFTLRAGGNPGYGRLSFDPSGFAGGFPGTFTLCDTRGHSQPRGVTLSMTGRVRTAETGDLGPCTS